MDDHVIVGHVERARAGNRQAVQLQEDSAAGAAIHGGKRVSPDGKIIARRESGGGTNYQRASGYVRVAGIIISASQDERAGS